MSETFSRIWSAADFFHGIDMSQRISAVRPDIRQDLLQRHTALEHLAHEQANEGCSLISVEHHEFYMGVKALVQYLIQSPRLAVARGTTAVIADPHEIANVCGEDGLDYMLRCAEGIPFDVHFMLPSCVPATGFEHSAGGQFLRIPKPGRL